MLFKLLGISSFSLLMILYGIYWLRKDLRSDVEYDFMSDFKDTFLTIHMYSNYLSNDKPRRIYPIMLILGGVFMFFVGAIKLLT